jgi:hypothetical protein
MPRDLFKIGSFDKGMVSNVDPSDASPESLHYMKDVDPVSLPGMLQGRKDHLSISDAVGYKQSITIQNENGTEDVIYYTGSEIYVTTDLFGTPQETLLWTFTTAHNTVSFHRMNKEIYVGVNDTPTLWIGKIGHNRYGVVPDTNAYVALELNL